LSLNGDMAPSKMKPSQLLELLRAEVRRDGSREAERLFKQFDLDHSGSIDKNELHLALGHYGIECTPQQTAGLMAMLDEDGSGDLEYGEFLNTILDDGNTAGYGNYGTAKQADEALRHKVTSNFKSLNEAFLHYDIDKNGSIDLDELRKAAARAGVNLTKQETGKLLDMYDDDSNGEISAQEFIQRIGQDMYAIDKGGLSALSGSGGSKQAHRVARMTIDQLLQAITQKLQSSTTGGPMQARKAFKKFDLDGDGSIDINELKMVLSYWTLDISDQQASALMRRLDADGSGKLDYQEFIDQLLDPGQTTISFNNGTADSADRALKNKIAASFKSLQKAFLHYDPDHNGQIDLEELRKAAAHAGVNLSEMEAARLMKLYDADGNGSISAEEFISRLGNDMYAADSGALSGLAQKGRRNKPLHKSKMQSMTTQQLLNIIRRKLQSSTTGGANQARKAFKQFDRDGSGTIDSRELKMVCGFWGMDITEQQANDLMASLDDDGNMELDYAEFIEHMLDQGATGLVGVGATAKDADIALRNKVAQSFKSLQKAFLNYDVDHNGQIDEAELRKAAAHAGVNLSKMEVKKLMMMYDSDGDGNISAEEFMTRVGNDMYAADKGGLSNLEPQGRGRGGRGNVATTVTQRMGTQQLLGVIRKILQSKTTGGASQARKAFQKIDIDNNGKIDAAELQTVLAMWNLEISQEQANALMEFLDGDGSGVLDYAEFVDHMMDAGATGMQFGKGTAKDADIALRNKVAQSFKSLQKAFLHNDLDHDGSIDRKELQKAAAHAGVHLNIAEMNRLMELYDTDGDGNISAQEFITRIGGHMYAGDAGSLTQNAASKNQQHNSAKVARMTTDQILQNLRKKLMQNHAGGRDDVQRVFQKFDPSDTGLIGMKHVKVVLGFWGLKITDDQAYDMVMRFDETGAGQMDYVDFCEFLTDAGNTTDWRSRGSAADADKALREKVSSSYGSLRKAFLAYDADHSGGIDVKELRKAASHAGVQLSGQEAQRLMDMYDADGNGDISAHEFFDRMGGDIATDTGGISAQMQERNGGMGMGMGMLPGGIDPSLLGIGGNGNDKIVMRERPARRLMPQSSSNQTCNDMFGDENENRPSSGGGGGYGRPAVINMNDMFSNNAPGHQPVRQVYNPQAHRPQRPQSASSTSTRSGSGRRGYGGGGGGRGRSARNSNSNGYDPGFEHYIKQSYTTQRRRKRTNNEKKVRAQHRVRQHRKLSLPPGHSNTNTFIIAEEQSIVLAADRLFMDSVRPRPRSAEHRDRPRSALSARYDSSALRKRQQLKAKTALRKRQQMASGRQGSFAHNSSVYEVSAAKSPHWHEYNGPNRQYQAFQAYGVRQPFSSRY